MSDQLNSKGPPRLKAGLTEPMRAAVVQHPRPHVMNKSIEADGLTLGNLTG